jgi:hypothetical protein
MTTNTNTKADAFTRLLDDLLWLHGRRCSADGLQEAMDAMVACYTDDANRYSDGSVVFEWYEEFPEYYFSNKGELHLPPHRRTATTDPASTNKDLQPTDPFQARS